MARPGRDGTPVVVAVPTYGPEPIGADQVEALQAGQGAELAGARSFPAEGLRGYDDQAAATFVSPQDFGSQAWALTTPAVQAGEPGVAGAAQDQTPLPPAWSQG